MYLGLDIRHVNEVHFALNEGIECAPGDLIIVRTIRAKEVARVIDIRETNPGPIGENSFIKKILRKAGDKDHQREEENRAREKKAFLIALKKIEKLSLPMKLIRVHYLFDHSRIIFFFKAANKVDFRQLVRDLAAVFKTRIELRQIGVRDEAKMLGGTGSCGRELCCSTFLRSFEPVTVKMAKLQHHTVNPSKISGQCGRLKCCIAYECPFYEDSLAGVPPIGAEVMVGENAGRLTKVNIFTGRGEVVKDDGTVIEIHLEQIRHCRYAINETDLAQSFSDEEKVLDCDLSDRSQTMDPTGGEEL